MVVVWAFVLIPCTLGFFVFTFLVNSLGTVNISLKSYLKVTSSNFPESYKKLLKNSQKYYKTIQKKIHIRYFIVDTRYPKNKLSWREERLMYCNI